MLVGRPYNSMDSGRQPERPQEAPPTWASASIPIDMLPLDSVAEDEDLKDMYWGYGQKILRAAKIIRSHPNLYAVYITNFGCGPDSFITHFFKKIMEGKPFPAAGDRRAQRRRGHHHPPGGLPRQHQEREDRAQAGEEAGPSHPSCRTAGPGRSTYLTCRTTPFPFAGAFRACGVEAEVMQESDEETMQIGRKYTLGKECYPCILTTGDMLKTSKRPDFDPDRSAFFMPSGSGPCRFGQYHRFHRMVLSDHGFGNVPIYAPNQDDRLYHELEHPGRQVHEARVEGDCRDGLPGQDAASDEALRAKSRGDGPGIQGAARPRRGGDRKRGDEIFPALGEAAEAFLSIPRTEEQKPVVGIVGEIYIRSNRFSNSDLVRKVEEFGGEAWLAPITEWITYVNYTGKKKIMEQGGLPGLFQMMLTQYIQAKDEHRMERIFEDYLRQGREPRVKRVLNQAMPYLDESFEGEAILTVGKSVDFIRKGASGIINAMPFTCMPGTVSSAIMTLIQNKYSLPVLNVAYDGQGESNTTTRLEAFMHQVGDYFRK